MVPIGRVDDVVELRCGHETAVGDLRSDGFRARLGGGREGRAGGSGIPREEDVRRRGCRCVRRGMVVLWEVRLGGCLRELDRGS